MQHVRIPNYLTFLFLTRLGRAVLSAVGVVFQVAVQTSCRPPVFLGNIGSRSHQYHMGKLNGNYGSQEANCRLVSPITSHNHTACMDWCKKAVLFLTHGYCRTARRRPQRTCSAVSQNGRKFLMCDHGTGGTCCDTKVSLTTVGDRL